MPGSGAWREKVCVLPLCPHSEPSRVPAQPQGLGHPARGEAQPRSLCPRQGPGSPELPRQPRPTCPEAAKSRAATLFPRAGNKATGTASAAGGGLPSTRSPRRPGSSHGLLHAVLPAGSCSHPKRLGFWGFFSGTTCFSSRTTFVPFHAADRGIPSVDQIVAVKGGECNLPQNKGFLHQTDLLPTVTATAGSRSTSPGPRHVTSWTTVPLQCPFQRYSKNSVFFQALQFLTDHKVLLYVN